jgi:ribose transport system substrate-binding protein
MDTPVADVWVSAKEWDMGYTIGLEAGKWIRDKLNGQAEVLILANDRIPQMITRKEGVIAGMTEHAPGAEVVAVQDANITELGMRVTENVLQAHPNLKVVVALNDAGALGALAAVESAGRDSDDFFIGGVDATPEAREKIDGGTVFRASVDNIPYENGMMDIEIMQRLLAGEDLEYQQVVPVEAYTQY